MTFSLPVRRATLAVVLIALVISGAFIARVIPANAAGASTAATQVLHLSARPNMVLRFNTSHLRAHPGRITIIMTNPSNSGMDHGIAVQGHGVDRDGPIVAPGHRSKVTVTLRKRGRYAYYCPVPGHRQAGMSGVLTVS
jgi:uncharacterized cupredoxin-like copper-binding protein